MLAIYKRELKAYMTSVIGYAFIALFLAVSGALFVYTTMYSMTANSSSYFTMMMLFFVVLLPLLTMKSFSEEKKLRTEQLLMTAPISIFGMVMAKYLAALTVFSASMVVAVLPFGILYRYAAVKTAVLLGNLVAILLVGGAILAIGIFVSALTENQLTAAVGTVGLVLVFFVISLLNTVIPVYFIRFILSGVSIFARYQNFTQGVFDFAALFYYLSVAAVFLFLTMRIFDRRRYR
ncbi:MAG: ABC transporter [Clostridia bacterium]|nr:ABC transporter [Clostridia bacterium]